MKPNKSQIEVIDCIIGTLGFWKGSNDISSSTHECDIDEELYAQCEDTLNDSQRYRLSRELIKVLNIIRELND